jgi:hypothetical protein
VPSILASIIGGGLCLGSLLIALVGCVSHHRTRFGGNHAEAVTETDRGDCHPLREHHRPGHRGHKDALSHHVRDGGGSSTQDHSNRAAACAGRCRSVRGAGEETR